MCYNALDPERSPFHPPFGLTVMQIEHLSLTNFRNYARLELSLPMNPVILHGDNAQGKTSLLEAIYYIATSQSPYTSSDRQLIHWRTENDPIPFARLTADIRSAHAVLNRLELTLLIDLSTGLPRYKKVIKHNGVEKRVMDVVGILNVVLFLPRDLQLIEGAPADRRRFMDTTLSQLDKDYLESVNEFDRILPQRNALLKRIQMKQASADQLFFWDTQLVQAASKIIAGRQGFLRELEVLAQSIHAELTGNQETLTLQYQPSFLPSASAAGQMSFDLLGLDLHREMPAADIADQYQQQLEANRKEEIERGLTISGPQRDELRILLNNRDCGLYGSRGQARTAVMALKLAELEWMKQHKGEYPVLLLDEVVAELDSKRRSFLLDHISDKAQTLMTTTELDIFTESFLQRAQVWHIHQGQIVQSIE
ncbi:DNA replication/repair protein RecF [Anaerolineales bacterium]